MELKLMAWHKIFSKIKYSSHKETLIKIILYISRIVEIFDNTLLFIIFYIY